MIDIVVAVLLFPNDPTKNRAAHQMFVAEQAENYIDLYSVSSIFGKEKRVYGRNRFDYVTIIPPESERNGFMAPSFIDCTKVYRIYQAEDIDLEKLAHRAVSGNLRERIFRNWNPRL